MRRADSTLAEPTPRDNWIERSTALRSPADVDYLTWLPVDEWRRRRLPGLQQPAGSSAFDRSPRLSERPRRRKPKPILNEQFVGGSDVRVTSADVIREIEKAKGALDPELLPGLLAAVLIERKVPRERARAIVAERFGQMSGEHLKRLTAYARKALEEHLTAAFGFLPQYQLRWVGTI